MSLFKSLPLVTLASLAALPALAAQPSLLTCKLHEICGEDGCHAPSPEANVTLDVAITPELQATLSIDGASHSLSNVKPAPVWRWRGTDENGLIHVFAWREDGGQATYLKINVDTVEVKASGQCVGE